MALRMGVGVELLVPATLSLPLRSMRRRRSSSSSACIRECLTFPFNLHHQHSSRMEFILKMDNSKCVFLRFGSQSITSLSYFPKIFHFEHHGRLVSWLANRVRPSNVYSYCALGSMYGFRKHPRCIKGNAGRQVGEPMHWMKSLLVKLLKLAAALFMCISVLVIIAPSFLSSSCGLRTTLFLTNKLIPGSISINSLSVGWRNNIIVENVVLKGIDGKVVLAIPKLETKAPLWSLVLGKSGFGDCSITSPMVDLQEEEGTRILRLALAIIHRKKLEAIKKKSFNKKMTSPSVDVALFLTIKAPGGDLKISKGKLLLPQDVAVVVGSQIHVDMLLGDLAKEYVDSNKLFDHVARSLPLHLGLWSECMELKAGGFVFPRKIQIALVDPIKIEIDLTPDVARFHLKRISPLLGDILGPAVVDDDMPDMTLYVSPNRMILPADYYNVHIEPTKAVLARGPLVTGLTSLLSLNRESTNLESSKLRVETSAIDVNVGTGGNLACSKFDLVLSGSVHIATWGKVDLMDERIDMILAIPKTTLQDFWALSNLPNDYYLEIPIKGTFDQPQVDWKSASLDIMQLALYAKGNKFLNNVLQRFLKEERVSEPESRMP